MRTFKTILIDDEKKALSVLRNKIDRYCPTFQVIGETADPREGIELINSLRPHLVFLDIAMPKLSGFDLLNKLDKPDFEIIFVTAFDEYAIDAIKHCAIGYLLKPVINSDLVLASENAIRNIESKTALMKNQILVENLRKNLVERKIPIPCQEGIEFVCIDEIVYFEGVKGYTKIYFVKKEPFLSSYSIGYFSNLLHHQDFYLVHKSYLINLKYIMKYINQGYLMLVDNHKVPVSRNRRNDFLNFLNDRY